MMDRIERIQQSFITRKAEKNDTHDYIQGHEPDFQKNKHKKQEDIQDHGEDLTDISVESLIVFLEGLIKKTATNTPDKKPLDSDMSKAIQAYDQSKPKIKHRYTYLDGHEDIEMSKIEYLINSLQRLQDKNILHVNLLSGDGFLQSIEMTVEKYQSLA